MDFSFRVKGESKTKSMSLGVCDPDARVGFGLAEARDRAAAILKAARQGRDLQAEEKDARRTNKERISVTDLIDRYAKHIRSPHRKSGALKTGVEIERRLKRALEAKLTKAADDLRRSDISGLLDPVPDGRPREAEKRRQVIGAMYRWGISKGYVATDPTAGTESYGKGDPRERALSRSELRDVWTWLDAGAGQMPPDIIAALRLQICLGARIGEVAGITMEEVEVEGDRLIWTLPASRSKNKRERVTPLVGMAREIVEQAMENRESGPLFRTALSKRTLTSADVGTALKVRTLPCAHFSSHDLRRSVVSFVDEMGIALDTIAAVVGHQRGSKAERTLVRHYASAWMAG